jgi:uncharacterized protein
VSDIVVSNTSPISNLTIIQHLHLLPALYGCVLVPNAVVRELRASASVRASVETALTDGTLKQTSVKDINRVQALLRTLDAGESEAISIAIEQQASLLLIDEREGRMAADSMELEITGVLGILIEAKKRGFVQAIKPLITQLQTEARFRLSATLVQQTCAIVGE